MARIGHTKLKKRHGAQFKLKKRQGTQLEIRVAKARSYNSPPSCEKSSDKIHITFVTHTIKRYLHSSNLSREIGLERVKIAEKTIYQDRRVFFEANNESESYLTISESLLEPLNVKADDVQDKIIGLVMRVGKIWNKKQDFTGLIVTLTFIKTFIGDRVSVHQALIESNREREAYLRQQGFNIVYVS